MEQVQKSDKNTEIKYPQGDQLFIGNDEGSLIAYSMIKKEIVYDFGQISDNMITLIAKTLDNKSQYTCGHKGHFRELDISTYKQVNSYAVKNARFCLVTHDNKFLITAEHGNNGNLTKWSIRSKKELNTWNSGIDEKVSSQICSYDNKYQLIGYREGYVSIFDLQIDQTLQIVESQRHDIHSMVFSRDNKTAYMVDFYGGIRIINFKANTNLEIECMSQKKKKVGNDNAYSICLTKDEKYLLIGSRDLISVFDTTTREVTKKINLDDFVLRISQIKDCKKAIVAYGEGNFAILDIETLEISLVESSITELRMCSILVI